VSCSPIAGSIRPRPDIGKRAGVDPTLIARYFGGKAQLFIAVLRAEETGEVAGDLLGRGKLESCSIAPDAEALARSFRPVSDLRRPAAQAAALDELDDRVVAPLRERFSRDGDVDPSCVPS